MVAVASSLTEMFAPDLMSARIAAWEKHYPWVGARGAGVLPGARAARAARRRGGAGVRRRERDVAGAAGGVRRRRWCARPRSCGTWPTACRRRPARRRRPDDRADTRVRLAAKVAAAARSASRASTFLLYPERGLELSDSAARIVALCGDGPHGRGDRGRADRGVGRAARADRNRGDKLPACARRSGPAGRDVMAAVETPRPYTLVAELTYRCPLACGYCSNPLDLARHAAELDTAGWGAGVRRRGGAGRPAGEPDRRRAAGARRSDGAGGGRARAAALRQPDHQRHPRGSRAARRAGRRGPGQHPAVGAGRRSARRRLDRRARRSRREAGGRGRGARARPAADAQRGHPPRQHRARDGVRGAGGADRRRAAGARQHAVPRLGAGEPRRAAAGARRHRAGPGAWPRRQPSGCAARSRSCSCARTTTRIARARAWTGGRAATSWSRPTASCCRATRPASITGLAFENVRDRPLADIWSDSPALRAFRGEDWMPAPCRTCDERHADFGGCRCQAFALVGDAGATDPACALSPRHDIVRDVRARAESPPAAPRRAAPRRRSACAGCEPRAHERRHRGRGPRQEVRRRRGGPRHRLLGRRGRDLRLPRAERRRARPPPSRSCARCCSRRRGGRAWPAWTSRRRPATCAAASASSSRTRRSTIG